MLEFRIGFFSHGGRDERGLEFAATRCTAELFMDMAAGLEYVEALAERVVKEYLKPFYTMVLEQVGTFVQLVIISDDYGIHEGLLFSPSVIREVFKPRLRRLVEHIKELVDAKVYMHSGGTISTIIPDFIKAGIDGLNPLQYTAKGMAADRLKRELGRDLGFFGGGIDNEILSFGSIEQVQCDVRRQVLELAPGVATFLPPSTTFHLRRRRDRGRLFSCGSGVRKVPLVWMP